MQPEMTAEALVDLLDLFEGTEIESWLDGGWAVDAVLGEQTRLHKDVDIIVRVSDLSRLRAVLKVRGFEVRGGGTDSNFVLADGSGSKWTFTPSTLTRMATVFIGWRTDRTGSFRRRDSADEVSCRICLSAV